jgi:predicted Zn-dependent protease
MIEAQAIVVPFGTAEAGLGLGLASLLHAFLRRGRAPVGFAQLRGEAKGTAPAPLLEALVEPTSWVAMAQRSPDRPSGIEDVITGSIGAPDSGSDDDESAHVTVRVFSERDARVLAHITREFDEGNAGSVLVAVLREALEPQGYVLGPVSDLASLSWDGLASVLRAEKAALIDATPHGPGDPVSAMMHLARAVSDDPQNSYAARRLAGFAHAYAEAHRFAKTETDNVLRTLEGAVKDAPGQLELTEALALVHGHGGDPKRAATLADEILDKSPNRPMARLVRSMVARRESRFDEAITLVEEGLKHHPDDPMLRTELGTAWAESGQLVRAEREWQRVLERHPSHPTAFANLAGLAMHRNDPILAEKLVDGALASESQAEVLRGAVDLALAFEPDGTARIARLGTLLERLVSVAPDDPWARLQLAKVRVQLGDVDAAVRQLRDIERSAPHTHYGAEARLARFRLEDATAAMELESALRAAFGSVVSDLDGIAARGRRLSTSHEVWLADAICAEALRRKGDRRGARAALDLGLSRAPGSALLAMLGVVLFLDNADLPEALRRARELSRQLGDDALVHGTLALLAAAEGDKDTALVACDRAEKRGMDEELRGSIERQITQRSESELRRIAAELLRRLALRA